MAEAEHPDESGEGGRERGARGGSAARGKTPAESGGGAIPSPPHTASADAAGGASMDSASDRGISGALALWGPLIIIGFLVLVLNTNDATRAPGQREAVAGSPPEERVAPAEPLPAPSAAERVAGEEERVAPTAASQVSEVEPAGAPAVAEPVALAVASAVEAPSREESGLAAAPLEVAATPQMQPAGAATAEEPAAEATGSAAFAGDLDLDTVLEVARAVIGQGDGGTRSEIAVASGSSPERAAPDAPAPTGATGAGGGSPSGGLGETGASGVAPDPWSVPEGAPGAETPIWSTGNHPWAVSPSPSDEATWGDGSGPPLTPGGNPDWPPAPHSGAAMPPLPPAGAMMSGSGYWPRPPVLVPCAPPWYWCIALPAPMYHPPPPGSY